MQLVNEAAEGKTEAYFGKDLTRPVEDSLSGRKGDRVQSDALALCRLYARNCD